MVYFQWLSTIHEVPKPREWICSTTFYHSRASQTPWMLDFGVFSTIHEVSEPREWLTWLREWWIHLPIPTSDVCTTATSNGSYTAWRPKPAAPPAPGGIHSRDIVNGGNTTSSWMVLHLSKALRGASKIMVSGKDCSRFFRLCWSARSSCYFAPANRPARFGHQDVPRLVDFAVVPMFSLIYECSSSWLIGMD